MRKIKLETIENMDSHFTEKETQIANVWKDDQIH